jgi:hypothetical protein
LDLETGIVLVDTVPAKCQPRPRLTVSSGLRHAPSTWVLSGSGGEARIRYDATAVVPEADWRPATGAELAVLRGRGPADSAGSSITVVRMPENIFGALTQARAALSSIEDLTQANDYFSRQDALRDVFRYAYQFMRTGSSSYPSGVRVNRAGLPTVTIDSSSGHLVGLHVDN